MEENIQKELELLKIENQQLKNELNDGKELKSKARKKTFGFIWKVFAGKDLKSSFSKWFQEFHSEKKITPEASANLFTSLVKRFVRVRLLHVILLLFSLLPSLVSLYVLIKQNSLIKTQNSLVESTRKSSYGFQLANIFDAIDDQGSNISNNLIGRIIGISHSLKPYKLLVDNKLSEKAYSPERAQLLLFLVNSDINRSDLNKIYQSADFSSCDLSNMNLTGKYLAGANLEKANFENTILDKSNLNKANLKNTNLAGIKFSNGNAIATDFSGADLQKAFMRYSDFNEGIFIGANLDDSILEFSSLKESCVTDASFINANVNNTVFTNAYFKRGFKFEVDNKARDNGNVSEEYFESTYDIKFIEDFNTIVKKK